MTDKVSEDKVIKSEEEWRRELTPEQYHIMREKGTDRPFANKYYRNHETGTYHCAACGAELFSSETKYESGSGWPSFWAPVVSNRVRMQADDSHFMHRTEVVCSRCGAHLGHLFDDGPQPTGERYCMNSTSLEFEPAEKKKE